MTHVDFGGQDRFRIPLNSPWRVCESAGMVCPVGNRRENRRRSSGRAGSGRRESQMVCVCEGCVKVVTWREFDWDDDDVRCD